MNEEAKRTSRTYLMESLMYKLCVNNNGNIFIIIDMHIIQFFGTIIFSYDAANSCLYRRQQRQRHALRSFR